METAARHAFVRTLVDGDLVGHREAQPHASHGQRVPLVQSQKAGLGRFPLHYERNVVEPPSEARRDRTHGLLHQSVKLLGRHSTPF